MYDFQVSVINTVDTSHEDMIVSFILLSNEAINFTMLVFNTDVK